MTEKISEGMLKGVKDSIKKGHKLLKVKDELVPDQAMINRDVAKLQEKFLNSVRPWAYNYKDNSVKEEVIHKAVEALIVHLKDDIVRIIAEAHELDKMDIEVHEDIKKLFQMDVPNSNVSAENLVTSMEVLEHLKGLLEKDIDISGAMQRIEEEIIHLTKKIEKKS
ncbi:hypothetical protein HQ545_01580 [Candidatus Woesearchaeota archaeon]|nr:hypothetical protein [Candidatus Woesearchaeota archaeon]